MARVGLEKLGLLVQLGQFLRSLGVLTVLLSVEVLLQEHDLHQRSDLVLDALDILGQLVHGEVHVTRWDFRLLGCGVWLLALLLETRLSKLGAIGLAVILPGVVPLTCEVASLLLSIMVFSQLVDREHLLVDFVVVFVRWKQDVPALELLLQRSHVLHELSKTGVVWVASQLPCRPDIGEGHHLGLLPACHLVLVAVLHIEPLGIYETGTSDLGEHGRVAC